MLSFKDGGNDLDEEELVIANCVDVHAAEDGGGRGLETLLASLLAPEEGEECGNVATNAGATASAGSSSVSSSACRFHMPLGIPAAAAESGGESAPEKLERGQIFAGRGSLEELREAEEKHQENGQQVSEQRKSDKLGAIWCNNRVFLSAATYTRLATFIV